MEAQRNYRNHGLPYTSKDTYDDELTIERLFKRKDKIKYTEDNDGINYLELAEMKIYEREIELERDLKVNNKEEHPSAHHLVMEEIEDLSRDKKILENGIITLELNNFVVTNPFKGMSHEFKEEFIENYVKHFNKIGRPEFQHWITE